MGNLFEQGEKYYFSRDLMMQLSKMPEYPVTIIEAPSGFGKTTAVREYLNNNLPATARQYWYTCLGESAPACWAALCDLFRNAAPEMAAKLKDLRMPMAGALANIALSEGEIICPADTYLVIDNFHLIAHRIISELKSLVAVMHFSHLHFILIAQQYPEDFYTLTQDARIQKIEASIFFFDKAGTDALFRLEGIRLSGDELENIYANTEGWIAAIRLQIINYREEGSLNYTKGIEALVEAAFWNRLTQEEKEFLVSVSVLDSFTPGQAAMMIGMDALPQNIEKLLLGCAFIQYNPDSQSYIIHSILQKFLRNRFYNHYSLNFQSQIMRRAGSYLAAVEEFCPAAVIYHRENDYQALLSLHVNGDYMISQKENDWQGFLENIVESCPDELLKTHPYTLLLYAYQLFLQERYQALAKIRRLLDAVLQEHGVLSQAELRILHGEYELHKTVCSFDNLVKKKKGCETAWRILQKPSVMITPDMPWPYACSLLNQLWTESGTLELSIEHMHQYDVEISPELVSKISEKIMPEVSAWQNRPLEPVYPFVFLDAIHYKVKENHQYVTKAAYVVLGITLDGRKDILGVWIGEHESSKFWLSVLNDLKSRGVLDVYLFCVDGLRGFCEAINAVYPQAQIQRCIIHQIRSSTRYVSYKDIKALMADLKLIYRAVTEDEALEHLTAFREKWGKQYPSCVKSWEENWDILSTFFAYPAEIRRIIYTTNIIEGLNRQFRQITKNKPSFTSDDSLRKMLYLASKKIVEHWTARCRNWDMVLSQLNLMFSERAAV